ncbi:MAG TPA: VOC family protein [Paracoccaceae bacterium]|nr:VOC family protein [Paracoccaceae bacterium]HMO70933.1 VOC family protein [Paracoccaceae bacterium]
MPRPTILGTLETALYAADLAAAERFYAGILGLPVILRQPGRHVFFRSGTSVLLVFDPAATAVPPGPGALPVPPHGADGPGHLCLTIAPGDLAAWRDHLRAEGLEIESEIAWPGGGRSIYVRDPAGNSVELADAALWA